MPYRRETGTGARRIFGTGGVIGGISFRGVAAGRPRRGAAPAERIVRRLLLGVRVEERRLPSGLCGVYYEPARLIVLDESMPDFQRRCTLCHELVHARYHDTGCGTPYGVKAERRARRETALRLINPVEYASAEAICDGDAYRIACELDVTLQVVEDYRRLLHDTLR